MAKAASVAVEDSNFIFLGGQEYTAGKLAYHSINMLLPVAEDLRNSGKMKEAHTQYSLAAKALKCSLLFGNGELAYVLAYLYVYGYGVKQNAETAMILLAIGKNFMPKLKQDKETSDDMYSFIKNLNFSDSVKAKADGYSRMITIYNRMSSSDTFLTIELMRSLSESFENSVVSVDPLLFDEKSLTERAIDMLSGGSAILCTLGIKAIEVISLAPSAASGMIKGLKLIGAEGASMLTAASSMGEERTVEKKLTADRSDTLALVGEAIDEWVEVGGE